MYTKIHNRKVHYKQHGNGDPLILLHGWGQNSYSLHHIAQKASQYFTVYTIDLPGFGKSDAPPKHWGLDGYAFMLKEFIRKKKLSHPHILGHAFGSSIVLMLAAKEPEIFKSLIISSTPLRQTKSQNKMSRLAQKIPHNSPGISHVHKFLRNLYFRIFSRNSDLPKFPTLEANFRKIIAQDLTFLLRKIRTPTLILWGELDTCTPVIYAYEMQRKIKNAEISVIPDANHDLTTTHPSDFWKEMKRFLLD